MPGSGHSSTAPRTSSASHSTPPRNPDTGRPTLVHPRLHSISRSDYPANHDRSRRNPAQPDDLVDVARLITAYYTEHPEPDDPGQQVSFGTSGHRGSSFKTSFNDDHIAATTQAICEYRAAQGIDGPLLIGRDTHGLSEPSYATALEVLVANDVTVLVDADDGFVPTPAISHAILTLNAQGRKADGIVVTPSSQPSHRRWLQVQPARRRPR